MDFKNKMLEVGNQLNNDEVAVIKFMFSNMITDSILENITNGCELIEVLERIFDIDPAKQKNLLKVLKTLGRHDLIRMFNSQQTHSACFTTDFEENMLEVGKRLNNDEVKVMKFLFSYLIDDSVLESITNGCEMMCVLKQVIENDPKKHENFLEVLKTLERHDLVKMFSSQQTQPVYFKMDDKEKILDVEKKSALESITSGCEMITELEQIVYFKMDDKEKILEVEKKSALESIKSGCEMITELEQIDKVRKIFRNPVFHAEFCKKIGFDWKRLAQNLSINQIEIDSIEYAYNSLEMRAYVMLTKYEICKPEDMIRALNSIEREDLVDEIERLTNISKDILFKISGNSAAEKSSGCNLECDQGVQINISQESILFPLKNKINGLYTKGTDKIRTFNANDVTIDSGVKELNEAINNITNNPELLKDQKIVERLFDSYIFIGNIYTSTCYSKFEGNIYTNKTPEKYKEAINAYERGFKYSDILHNDFQHDRFLHKLVTILNKPTDYGYDETVRDQAKYNKYFIKYKCSIRYRYEEGMRCLKECDFINAIYFFEKEIETSEFLESKGCSFMHVAMTFHFKKEKTNANFQRAVSYYKKAIDIFINQRATDITGDVTCCYYYLCKLFSNPSSYGFDSVLKDVDRAAKISKLNYIEGNVHRLLTQAEIYACKRFPWIQDKTDLDPDKVLDYCERALNASNVNLDIKTKIYYLMTCTYSSLITEKNYDVYFNAIAFCQKALETFKTGQKRKDQEYAERIVTESIALAHFPKTRGFEDINKNNSKPLRDLLDEIYKSKDYKIINFKEMKDYQMLHGFEPTLEKRVTNICIAEISVNSGNKSKEFKRSVSEAKEIVISTTNKLKKIEKNRGLYHYYFGFIKTFSKSYMAALSVISGQLALNTDINIVKASTFIINLIPFFGKVLATSMKEIMEFLKSAEIQNAAVHLSSLSPRANEFEDMIQDIIVEIIFDNKEKFLTKSFDHKAKTWFEKINNFCRSAIENIDEAIYVPEFPEDMHKLGHRDAVKIIKKISNGHIFGEKKNGACLLPCEKIELLKKEINNVALNCQQSKEIYYANKTYL